MRTTTDIRNVESIVIVIRIVESIVVVYTLRNYFAKRFVAVILFIRDVESVAVIYM